MTLQCSLQREALGLRFLEIPLIRPKMTGSIHLKPTVSDRRAK